MVNEVNKAADEKLMSDRDLQKKTLALLQELAKSALDQSIELHARLSSINFQTNGAAAIAILAFLGSGLAPDGVVYPLSIFMFGVVASGIQVRSRLYSSEEFESRISDQRKKIREGQFRFEAAGKLTSKEIRYNCIEHAFGWVSQLCFFSGVLASGWVFLNYTAAT